jgi:hypothetical protein
MTEVVNGARVTLTRVFTLVQPCSEIDSM